MGWTKQRESTAPIKSLVKLQPWLLSLRWNTCLRQNCSLGFSACSEGPAIWQNTLMIWFYQPSPTTVKRMAPIFLTPCINVAEKSDELECRLEKMAVHFHDEKVISQFILEISVCNVPCNIVVDSRKEKFFISQLSFFYLCTLRTLFFSS